jgi:hypothetical protein
MTFPAMLQFLIFFGTGFEVLRVMRIHKRSMSENHIVCYMVINGFVEYSRCIFIVYSVMVEVCAD